MVRRYVKKRDDSSAFDEEAMKDAMKAVLVEKMSSRKAAERFGVNRNTLFSRLRKMKKKIPENQDNSDNDASSHDDSGNDDDDGRIEDMIRAPLPYANKFATMQVFTQQQEVQLAKYLKECSEMNYGLTRKQLRQLAAEFAVISDCKNIPPSWRENMMTGKDWFVSFMVRQKDLRLRMPENTSLARSMAFNRENVGNFFKNLRETLDRHKFKPERIYNLDETGITTVMRPPKVIATKGKKQVGLISSAERGDLLTMVGIISASGVAIPPVYVFPRVRHVEDFIEDAPPSSLALGSKNGWMTGELFNDVLVHIRQHTHCSKANPILLIFDNHKSHLNFRNVLYCKENGIVVLTLPPHCSHKIQPLDVSVFGPFKARCVTAISDYITNNPGRPIRVTILPRLTKDAYLESFCARNIISGFQKTGISPFNSQIFTDEDFIAAEVTDRPLPSPQIPSTAGPSILSIDEGPAVDLESNMDVDEAPVILLDKDAEPGPSSSKTKKSKGGPTPEMVRPYPKYVRPEQKRNVRRSKSAIYTDTPELNKLKQLEADKTNVGKTKRSLFNTKPKKGKKNKKEATSSSSEGYDSDDGKDSIPFLLDDEQISMGNFLLVQFTTKKTIVHFIGQVTELYGLAEYKVKFLRRQTTKNTFVFPDVVDESSVERRDVVAKLIPSKHLRNVFTFAYDYKGFNMR